MKTVATVFQVCAFLVGALILWAGMHTIWQPAEVALALAVLVMNIKVSTALAICVAVIEVHVGLLLLLRRSSEGALRAGLLLLFGFTVFLWYLRNFASLPSCGCPGLHGLFSSNRQAALFGMFRNVVLILLLLGASVSNLRDTKTYG